MRCPECSALSASEVYDTRVRSAGRVVWRKRKCRRCEHKWSTWESTNNPIRDSVTLRSLTRAVRKSSNDLLRFVEAMFDKEKPAFGRPGEDDDEQTD